jgi:hypothetical protein
MSKQTEKVLEWLRTQGELTTLEAVTELHIMSLPRRIMELRRQGIEIETEYRTSPGGVRYGVYYLKEKTPKSGDVNRQGRPVSDLYVSIS